MAETTGLVQSLSIVPNINNQAIACFGIGPTPANFEILYILRDSTDSSHIGDFKNSIVDTLATAMVNRQEVIAVHADDSASISSLTIEPA